MTSINVTETGDKFIAGVIDTVVQLIPGVIDYQ
jgi:hypothetical protein